MTARRHDEPGATMAVVPTPAARLGAQLTYLRGQIAAHRSGPPFRPRVVAAIAGTVLALVTALSISIPSCAASAQDQPLEPPAETVQF